MKRNFQQLFVPRFLFAKAFVATRGRTLSSFNYFSALSTESQWREDYSKDQHQPKLPQNRRKTVVFNRTHGNVSLRFCIVSSNELVVLDSLEKSKQYKNAGNVSVCTES